MKRRRRLETEVVFETDDAIVLRGEWGDDGKRLVVLVRDPDALVGDLEELAARLAAAGPWGLAAGVAPGAAA